MEAQKTYQKLLELMQLVQNTDDFISSTAKRLRIVLFNLKIEGARCQAAGVEPIANELQRNLEMIDHRVTDLTNHRAELIKVLQDLKVLLNLEG